MRAVKSHKIHHYIFIFFILLKNILNKHENDDIVVNIFYLNINN